jgi:hypothetical protein
MSRYGIRILLLGSGGVLPLLGGCAWLDTHPGHPDSYQYTSYYRNEKHWPTTASKSSQPAAPSSDPANEVYLIAKTPREIFWNRRAAYEFYVQYKDAAYKAQDREDQIAIPLFGAAIAVAATGIAHASTLVVAAAGLGGSAVGAGFAYLQPDKDAVTDQAAESKLICVVDQSKVLNDLSPVPLVLDKDALQQALEALEQSSGALAASTDPNDQSAQEALQKVEDAGAAGLKSLNAAIAAYVALPGEIGSTANTIDQNAKSSSARTISYAGILQSLQTSSQNQTNKDNAVAKNQDATAAVATATAVIKAKGDKTGAAAKALNPNTHKTEILKENDESVPSLDNDANLFMNVAKSTPALIPAAPRGSAKPESDAGGASDAGNSSAAVGGESSPVGSVEDAPSAAGTPVVDDGQEKKASLKATLDDATINDMTVVTKLVQTATNDIPDPNFSDIAASIKACALGK